MLEGKPHILVIGGADTGRGPLLAALLRRALAGQASVASAGVVAHVGEPADPNVELALEQFGLSAGNHLARQLDDEAARGADLLVAVDRGAARVATMRGRQNVAAISELASAEDVPDPHRMPLGVWVAAMRAYEAQLATALPSIRSLARIGARGTEAGQAAAVEPAAPVDTHILRTEAPTALPAEPANTRRSEHLQRIHRLLETARVLPEIVDWSKLVQEACERLRQVARAAEGKDDLTPAATAMFAGLLLQTDRTPDDARLGLLLEAAGALEGPLDAGGLAAVGRIAGRWMDEAVG